MRALNTNHVRGLVVALSVAAAACAVPAVATAAEPVMRIAFPSGMNGQIVALAEALTLPVDAGMAAIFGCRCGGAV